MEFVESERRCRPNRSNFPSGKWGLLLRMEKRVKFEIKKRKKRSVLCDCCQLQKSQMDKVGGRSAAVHSSIVMCRTPMDANLVRVCLLLQVGNSRNWRGGAQGRFQDGDAQKKGVKALKEKQDGCCRKTQSKPLTV